MGLRQVKDDFCEFFIDRAGETKSDGAATGALAVSLEGFREYYRDVGVCEPYDTVFVPMIEVGMPQKMRYMALFGRYKPGSVRQAAAFGPVCWSSRVFSQRWEIPLCRDTGRWGRIVV